MLGDLFANKQAQDFTSAMLSRLPEYYQLKAEALASVGNVDADYTKRMQEVNEQMKSVNTATDNLSSAVGGALLSSFSAVMQPIVPLLKFLADLAISSPMTTTAIIALGAALVLLPAAIGLISTAWTAMSGAMMATGIGALIAVIGIGALLIIENWGAVKTFFLEHGRTILAFFGPLGWAAIALIDNWSTVSSAFGRIWTAISSAWDSGVGFIKKHSRTILLSLGLISPMIGALGLAGVWLMDRWEPVSKFFSTLWDGITKTWKSAIGKIMELWNLVSGPVNATIKFMGLSGEPHAGSFNTTPDPLDTETLSETVAEPEITRPRETPPMPMAGDAMETTAMPSGGAGLRALAGNGVQAAQALAQAARIDILVRFLNPPSGTTVQTRSSDNNIMVSAAIGPALEGI